METDLGKLFIGGISWDTDEERLKEYFGTYGEVVEAVIMRDRATGRARGFGFIIFADQKDAERVVMEKHMIDGRTVEAKKAVPRDDQNILNRKSASIQGSPSPTRTKKIFVGGLASSVTESDFKDYFDQFGVITDVVVMYDHNTQRPRGFGFITYDAEEAVDRVLHKTFHELNGKMVEVKRAVPKELSPGPSRSPLIGYNYGFNRPNGFLNSYGQGYNLGSLGSYGVRMDGRFNPIGNSRNTFTPFGSLGYGVGVNLDPGLSMSFGNTNFGNNLGYGRVLSPYYTGSPNRYSTPVGYGGANIRNDSLLNSPTRNVWGNTNLSGAATVGSPNAYLGSVGANFGMFGNNGGNWGSAPLSPQAGAGGSVYANGTNGYFGGENNYGLNGGGFARNNSGNATITPSFSASNGGYDASYGELYGNGSVYGESTWQPVSSEMEGSGSFGYELSNGTDVAAAAKGPEGFLGNYSITNRQASRGIAA